MKTVFTRRMRHRKSSAKDGNLLKKDNQQEQVFFGEAINQPFFQPTNVLQRKCEQCEEEDKKMQRVEDKEEEKEHVQAKGADGAGVSNTAVQINAAVNSRGTALPASLQAFFSQRLQYDFSQVKIHTGTQAQQSAKSIRAQAYTYGNHIVFASGKYRPGTTEGRKLLAHELTHVMQQQGVQRKLQMKVEKEESGIAEQEALKNEEVAAEPISLPDMFTFGTPAQDTVFANSVRFTGKTDADFDGGSGQTKKLKAMPARDCSGCGDSDCMTVTGILEVTYHVTTTVSIPPVPDGLTPCQHKRVKTAIDSKIVPHEQQHVMAFNTYNGTVNLPINYTGCRDGLEAYLQNLHDTDGVARKAAAKAKSDALDPFFVDVDLDCKEPEPPKK